MRRTLTLALLALFALAPAARAQIGADNALGERERDIVIDALALTDEQVDALDELALAANLRHAAILEEHRERYQEYFSDRADFDSGAMMRLQVERDEALDANRETLFDDLALMLPASQRSRIDHARMRVRRIQLWGLVGNEIVGFGADPARIAVDLDLRFRLDEERLERFRAAMETYDRVVDRRITDVFDVREKMVEVATERGNDPSNPAFRELAQELLDHAIELRDAHRRRADAVRDTLPDEMANEWRDAWRRATFEEVYRTARGELAIIAALDAASPLTPDEREAVEQIRDERSPRYAVLRRTLTRAIYDAQSDLTAADAFESDGFGVDTNPDVARARERFEAHDDETLRRLRAVFTPERLAELPAVERFLAPEDE